MNRRNFPYYFFRTNSFLSTIGCYNVPTQNKRNKLNVTCTCTIFEAASISRLKSEYLIQEILISKILKFCFLPFILNIAHQFAIRQFATFFFHLIREATERSTKGTLVHEIQLLFRERENRDGSREAAFISAMNIYSPRCQDSRNTVDDRRYSFYRGLTVAGSKRGTQGMETR